MTTLLRRGLLLLLVLAGVAGLVGQTKAGGAGAGKEPAKRVFKAGAATSNITPPLGMPIVGGFSPKPSSHIHDELHARCLVLDDGKTKIALVICDMLSMPAEVASEAKALITEATGIPASHVLISATHTHSGSGSGSASSTSDDRFNNYRKLIVRRIADGVTRAVRHLEPARIGWGAADEPDQVFNRRWYMQPDSPALINPFGLVDIVKMNPPSQGLIKPAGPVDPQISFISVQSLVGKPIALYANYGLHYVGGGTAGAISADYFAEFADQIMQKMNADRQDPPFVGMMSNGTSGDVNNIDRRPRDPKGPPARRWSPWEKQRFVAEECAKRVMEAHKNVRFHDHVTLGAVTSELTLALRKPSPELVAWAKEIQANRIKHPHALSPNYAGRVLRAAEDGDSTTILLQAMRIGELGITAIPFEVFAEIGLEIKKRSALKPNFVVSQANGSGGYLPTPEQHKLGGYETWLGTNRVEIEASRKITERLLEMSATLKPAAAE